VNDILKDEIGLTLTDTTGMMTEWPFVIITADPGWGKSTLLARSFGGQVDKPGALFLLTNKQVLRPYASWCRENPEEVLGLGMRTVFMWNPEWTPAKAKKVGSVVDLPPFLDGLAGIPVKQRPYDKGGLAVKVIPKLKPADVGSRAPNLELAYRIVNAYGAGAAKGVVPYSGLVWDEGTEFFRRWAAEIEDVEDWVANVGAIKTSLKDLRKSGFARRVGMNEFVDWFTNVPRSLECFMALVCHRADPAYFGQAKTDPPQRMGELKYRGGPQLTTGPLRTAVSAIADAVLEGVIDNMGTRKLMTKLTETHFRKFRDFGVGESIAIDHFHWALYRAGYGVPRPLGDMPDMSAAASAASPAALL